MKTKSYQVIRYIHILLMLLMRDTQMSAIKGGAHMNVPCGRNTPYISSPVREPQSAPGSRRSSETPPNTSRSKSGLRVW